jgi:hypothetical protein
LCLAQKGRRDESIPLKKGGFYMKLFIYRHCYVNLDRAVIKHVIIAEDREKADCLFENVDFLYAKKFLNGKADNWVKEEHGWLEVQETELQDNSIYC